MEPLHQWTPTASKNRKKVEDDLVKAVKNQISVYGHGIELGREELKRLADRYGYWQGYWAHYLRVGA